jgi:hypothetical protein
MSLQESVLGQDRLVFLRRGRLSLKVRNGVREIVADRIAEGAVVGLWAFFVGRLEGVDLTADSWTEVEYLSRAKVIAHMKSHKTFMANLDALSFQTI